MTSIFQNIRNSFLARAVNRNLDAALRVSSSIKALENADKDNAVTVMIFGSLLSQCEEGVLEGERYRLQLSHIITDISSRHASPILAGQQEVVALWKNNLSDIKAVGKKLGITRARGMEYMPTTLEVAA